MKKFFKRIVLPTLIIFIVLVAILDHQLRPLIKSVSASKASIISTNVINNVVESELSNSNTKYEDIVDIVRDVNGKVISINTNIKTANLLKANIAKKVQDEIANLSTQKIFIPVGTFTGVDLLSGRGPSVSLQITLSGNVVIQIKSEFSSAGINQTNHKIFLDVSTNVYALIPGYPVTTAVQTNILIAETVIVGDIPDYCGADFAHR